MTDPVATSSTLKGAAQALAGLLRFFVNRALPSRIYHYEHYKVLAAGVGSLKKYEEFERQVQQVDEWNKASISDTEALTASLAAASNGFSEALTRLRNAERVVAVPQGLPPRTAEEMAEIVCPAYNLYEAWMARAVKSGVEQLEDVRLHGTVLSELVATIRGRIAQVKQESNFDTIHAQSLNSKCDSLLLDYDTKPVGRLSDAVKKANQTLNQLRKERPSYCIAKPEPVP